MPGKYICYKICNKKIEYCCCKITYWVRQVVPNYEKIEAKTINRARLLLNGKGACNVILLYCAPSIYSYGATKKFGLNRFKISCITIFQKA